MVDQRKQWAKLNVIVSLVSQFINVVCGLIVPRMMIGRFGSEAYGATTSIAQFLSYITLLEAGIGGVARAALYKPLAENDYRQISAVLQEIKRFFYVIGFVFTLYVLFLAGTYKAIAHVEIFDWLSCALLVIVISISTFAKYFIGISYAILLQAAQRTYITQALSTFATILNAVGIVVLLFLGSDLIEVKLFSSLLFAIRPVLTLLYVKKHFKVIETKERNLQLLEQKWEGLGQHLAFFLHSNTDVVVLTILSDLKSVAVYSVYNMIVKEIQNVTSSFSTGMEAVFGDMLAKKEDQLLKKTFSYYESLISYIALILFSVTAVCIIPFVRLYTSKIADANYIYPLFGLLMVIASLLYCLRMPYHSIIIAAGHFRRTRVAAFGEAAINILLSITLVFRYGLVGLAVGTLLAVLFRMVFYAIYLSKNILNRKIELFIKRSSINLLTFMSIVRIGTLVVNSISITNYFLWIMSAALVCLIAIVVVTLVMILFYRDDSEPVVRRIFNLRSSK